MTILDCCCCCCGGEDKSCKTIFRNKCCICCLVFMAVLFVLVIVAKVYVTNILNEVEADSFETTFHGLAEVNGTNQPENPLVSWEAPANIRDELGYSMTGHDLSNRPIWIDPFGRWDLKGLLNAHEDNDKNMRIYMDQFVYRIQQSMHTRNVSDWVLIGDMDGYSYSQLASFGAVGFTLRMARKMLPIMEKVAYGYIINLDYFSTTLINMLRPIFGSNMDKLEMIGSDKDKIVQAMLKKYQPTNCRNIMEGLRVTNRSRCTKTKT